MTNETASIPVARPFPERARASVARLRNPLFWQAIGSVCARGWLGMSPAEIAVPAMRDHDRRWDHALRDLHR
jgi:hypothetical protein